MFRNCDENFLDDGLEFSKLRFNEKFPTENEIQKIKKYSIEITKINKKSSDILTYSNFGRKRTLIFSKCKLEKIQRIKSDNKI
jgi:hypothetical protein